MTWDPELAELAHRKQLAAQLGGPERVERQHATGRLTVRERLDALLGAFLLLSAVQFDPRQAKGLDAALQTLAEQPYGVVALVVATVGLLAYGLWSYVEAAYRDL